MAVQRSQSQPGAFRAGVANAQAGRGSSFHSAHSAQHEDALSRLGDHARRLAALEDLDPTTFSASAGKIKPPGPENFEQTHMGD